MTSTSFALKNIGAALYLAPGGTEAARKHWRAAFLDLMSKESEPGTAFAAAYASRDVTLLRAVFAHWPEADWNREIAQNKSIKPGSLMVERRYDHLRALRDAGVHLGSTLHLLVEVAQKRDDPKPIHFLAKEFGYSDLIWKQNDFSFYLYDCGPGLAPLMWQELQHHMQNRHSRAMRSFTQFRLGFCELKPFAALLASGKDIRSLYRGQIDTAHPHLLSLIEKTGSKHGQLALKALEPDPIDVIGRANNGLFYGMSAKTFQEDYPERTQS